MSSCPGSSSPVPRISYWTLGGRTASRSSCPRKSSTNTHVLHTSSPTSSLALIPDRLSSSSQFMPGSSPRQPYLNVSARILTTTCSWPARLPVESRSSQAATRPSSRHQVMQILRSSLPEPLWIDTYDPSCIPCHAGRQGRDIPMLAVKNVANLRTGLSPLMLPAAFAMVQEQNKHEDWPWEKR